MATKEKKIKRATSPAKKGTAQEANMLYIYSTNLKAGRWAEFQKWIASDGKQLFARAVPDGWKLRGAYLTAFNLGEAQVEIHWEIESYAAFDHARKAARERGPWFESLERMHSFLDPAGARARLLTNVAEGVIVGC